MEKPIILVEQEMKGELVNVINRYSSKLPMTMIISALDNLNRSCNQIAEQQLERAKNEYEAQLVKESSEENIESETVVEE